MSCPIQAIGTPWNKPATSWIGSAAEETKETFRTGVWGAYYWAYFCTYTRTLYVYSVCVMCMSRTNNWWMPIICWCNLNPRTPVQRSRNWAVLYKMWFRDIWYMAVTFSLGADVLFVGFWQKLFLNMGWVGGPSAMQCYHSCQCLSNGHRDAKKEQGGYKTSS